MTEFAPPNPNDLRIPASEMPVLGGAVINIATRPEQAADSLEWRVGQLTDQISALPDTTSAEVALNPDRPDHTMKLSELEAAGKGWKGHLKIDPQNLEHKALVERTLQVLQDSGAVTAFKLGNGGGEEEGSRGKEVTVGFGSKDKAILVAAFLSKELREILLEHESGDDTVKQDTELATRVMGRFEVKGYDEEFADASNAGYPILKDRIGNLIYGGGETEQDLVDSQARLVEKYGAFYTGSPEDGEPLISRYDPSDQLSVDDLDDAYPGWREYHPDADPQLLLFDAVAATEAHRIAQELDIPVVAEKMVNEGLDSAIEGMPKEVSERFQAHGIAGKSGEPSVELDKLLTGGIDPNRIFYTMHLGPAGEAAGALGADMPFTEGGLVTVFDKDDTHGEKGIKYVIVGEKYMKVFDEMKNRWKSTGVTFVPWHDAPGFFTDIVNRVEGTSYEVTELPKSYAPRVSGELPVGHSVPLHLDDETDANPTEWV